MDSLEAQAWLNRFPLRVANGKIVDAQGQRFRFIGVNWYGASDIEHVVGGLHKRNICEIAKGIKDLGFNVVRLPFSHQMMKPETVFKPNAINYDLNPQLRNKTPLEVLDAVVDALGAYQVAVIPNSHCCFAAWGGDADANGLWFCTEPKGDPPAIYTEEQFLKDWQTIARRYRDRAWVVGYDLRNEVRPVQGRPVQWPVWGKRDGAGTSGFLSIAGMMCYHDWRAVAGQTGKCVLAENPDKLIVVERIVFPAIPLRVYLEDPPDGIPADRLVLGIHIYDWTGPGIYIPSWNDANGWNKSGSWKKSVTSFLRTSMVGRRLGGARESRNWGEMPPRDQLSNYYEDFGNVLRHNSAPVFVSEIGVEHVAQEGSRNRVWFETLMSFLHAMDADYAYWPLNGGQKPTGGDEFYGLLDPDWQPHPEDWRRQLLWLQDNMNTPIDVNVTSEERLSAAADCDGGSQRKLERGGTVGKVNSTDLPMSELPGRLLFGLECVGFQTPQMLSTELHEYLLGDDICNASAEELLSQYGFVDCNDDCPAGHSYYEGYFHCLATSAPLESVHPRFGSDFLKPAAPPRLRGFCEALREVNMVALRKLAAAAPEGSSARRLIEEGKAFGDMAFQVRYGNAVSGADINWHSDAPNSMLHFAMGLRGHRILHAKLREPSETEAQSAMNAAPLQESARTRDDRLQLSAKQEALLRNGETDFLSFPQKPGAVYVGNPIAYVHAVEYPATTYADRIVAVQVRLLMTMAEILLDEKVEWGAEQVAAAIAAIPLVMPSLAEVQQAVAKLAGD